MRAFHVDMNMAHYRSDYLIAWLEKLAAAGYDAILWEIESSVRFDTCPECASPEAFSKDEFRDILQACRRLKLEPIPLLQTIGHAEYVLKQPEYAHLRELPDTLDQYCPLHPKLLPFLHRWMEEYVELFGPLTYFHCGADEAWRIGSCRRCKDYTAEHSLSELYVDHVNRVIEPLVERGITPIIWADMLLHFPEALDRLSHQVMLFDWIYSVYRGSGKVHVWGEGLQRGEDLSRDLRQRYGPYLFPDGDEPGREPETFYTADFLAAQGFKVVTCPAASSYGDNVFSPRNWLHAANTFDSFRKGTHPWLYGSALTSWSVHLFPWELQWASIAVASFLLSNPGGRLHGYPAWFEKEHFGVAGSLFWKPAGLLSKSCLFTHTASLGFGKDCRPAPRDHVAQTLIALMDRRQLAMETENCQERLAEYEQGLEGFKTLRASASRNQDEIELWALAARNLIARARESIFLLENPIPVMAGRALNTETERSQARDLLAELRSLKEETRAVYRKMIRPRRCAEMLAFMYAPIENALVGLIG